LELYGAASKAAAELAAFAKSLCSFPGLFVIPERGKLGVSQMVSAGSLQKRFLCYRLGAFRAPVDAT
jgi:hypothetical protein